MPKIKYGLYMFAELLLRLCIPPRLRATCLRFLGARIGSNVRIYECRFINIRNGFKQLQINDNVHIGTDCLIDLEGPLTIGRSSTLSPRVVIMTHSDPGSAHDSAWCQLYPTERRGVKIGRNCWIGASSTLLSGSIIEDRSAIGAGSLVRGNIEGNAIYAGVPARKIKTLTEIPLMNRSSISGEPQK